MGQYVYTVACATVFIGIILSLSPDNEGGTFWKYISFIGALALAITMLSPLPSFLSKKADIDEMAYEMSVDITERSAEYYANSAAYALYELYKTDPSHITASVTTANDGDIKEIILTVNESTYYSTKEAGKVLTDIYGIDITVRNGG